MDLERHGVDGTALEREPSGEPGEEEAEQHEKRRSGSAASGNPDNWPYEKDERPRGRAGGGAGGRPTAHRRSTSVHDSLYTAISQLRSRGGQAAAGAREPFQHPLARQPTGAEHIVDFDGPSDPYRPMNWPFRKKVVTTLLYSLTTGAATFASAVYSSGTDAVAAEYDVSTLVATLGTAVMLFGFGLGPLVWGPLSELYGRKPAVLTPYFVAAMFSFATGASKDIQSIIITRFFAGFFGSAPITNTGGVLGDIWPPEQRGMALVGYAIAVTGGPTIGPVVGGAIVSSRLGWRWTQFITGIMMMTVLTLDVLLLDESYGPALLVHKAQRLRHESGNWALHARHEEWDVSLREIAHKYLVRPFKVLFTPIASLIALYAAFVYGVLFANLGAFPVEFQEVRGWGPVVGALPFLALFLGICVGGAANVFNNKYYNRKFVENGRRAVPEARLPPMMFGSVVFAGGMFLFAWTSDPSVSPWPSLVGIGITGVGFFTIFQAALNYLIDTFTKYGASAIAANTFLRSAFAGAFPLFVTPMLHRLGVAWGVSVFAFFALLLIPVPYLFFVYGRRIRAANAWSRDSV